MSQKRKLNKVYRKDNDGDVIERKRRKTNIAKDDGKRTNQHRAGTLFTSTFALQTTTQMQHYQIDMV